MTDYVVEGDTCPECGEGEIWVKFDVVPVYMECDKCGAKWNDRGEKAD